MVMHRIHISEGTGTADQISASQPVKKTEYLVLKPIFKRGREWQAGEHIELDENTAKGFIENKEIMEVTNEA